MPNVTYDIMIIGGSLGGVSAALSAGRAGASVCLLEAGGWLGGQYTSQGVSKPDENHYVDTVGSTRSYQEFKHLVRAYYRSNYHLSKHGAAQPSFNPGGPYPGFAMEPKAGHAVLLQMLTTEPSIHVRLNTQVVSVEMNGDAIASISGQDSNGTISRYLASFFLDATDLGELLPLCGQRDSDWVLGAESQAATEESNAPSETHPEWIQPITCPFALERRPVGENHVITPPADYEAIKATQGYTIEDGYINSMFATGHDMWSYRQFISAANFADPAFPNDLSMMNMGSTDYQGGTIPTDSAENDAAVIAAARQASLGFCYWIQTECPRDGEPGKTGYPELMLRKDVFGTDDGTSAAPYIRESRRIKAVKTIVQQEIDTDRNPGPRASLFRDSCGIGHYGGMDIHALTAVGMPQSFREIKPFQIALGALVPVRWTNLLPACKNLGVTHLTNGAYRLHPVEWNIGESAGLLAAFCVTNSVAPQAVPSTADLLRGYQHTLLDNAIPLFWWSDIPLDSPYFKAVQLLGVTGIASGYGDMSYQPQNILSDSEAQDFEAAVGRSLNWPKPDLLRSEAALWLSQELGL